tara:strand:- start:3992 stop:4294 length:303 start_codon:yes stop_codon:yes gene_type:complete
MNVTKKEKLYWDRLISEIGCCVCFSHLGIKNNDYCSIHHIDGRTKKGSHTHILPLCSAHHQTGGEGVAIHPFKKQWEENYGSQESLKIMCDKILDGKESF